MYVVDLLVSEEVITYLLVRHHHTKHGWRRRIIDAIKVHITSGKICTAAWAANLEEQDTSYFSELEIQSLNCNDAIEVTSGKICTAA